MKPDLRVKIGGLVMANPVGLASGTIGYGSEYEKLVGVDAMGAIYTKAVSIEPRPGNRVPRIVETSAGMLNSIGLANPGIEVFLRDKLPELRTRRCAVIVNVAGGSEDEYLRIVERIEDGAGPWPTGPAREASASGVAAGSATGPSGTGVDGYEINLSCPNAASHGLAFGTDPTQVERITRSIRGATRRPLIVKLTPNVTDITAIARAAEAGGADAVSCINTLVGMTIDVARLRPHLAMGTGGLSGPAVLPVGVACCYKVSRAVKIPVIGLGGIMSADDALQYLLAGARAIQVGTGTFVDPRCASRVLSGIEAWMKASGAARVEDISGMLKV